MLSESDPEQGSSGMVALAPTKLQTKFEGPGGNQKLHRVI